MVRKVSGFEGPADKYFPPMGRMAWWCSCFSAKPGQLPLHWPPQRGQEWERWVRRHCHLLRTNSLQHGSRAQAESSLAVPKPNHYGRAVLIPWGRSLQPAMIRGRLEAHKLSLRLMLARMPSPIAFVQLQSQRRWHPVDWANSGFRWFRPAPSAHSHQPV